MKTGEVPENLKNLENLKDLENLEAMKKKEDVIGNGHEEYN